MIDTIAHVDHDSLTQAEETLLLITHASERARRAARDVRRAGGDSGLARALDDAASALVMTHGKLQRRTYFGAPSEQHTRQLDLDAA